VLPTSCSVVQTAPGNLQITLPTQAGLLYTVEAAPDLSGPWQSTGETWVGDGKALVLALPAADIRFYRIRIE